MRLVIEIAGGIVLGYVMIVYLSTLLYGISISLEWAWKEFWWVIPLGLIFLIVSFASKAFADTIIVRQTNYNFEETENITGTLCRLSLIISNSLAPENLELEFVAGGRSNLKDSPFAAYIISVGESPFIDAPIADNGGAKLVPLQSAEFSSDLFNSSGRIVEKQHGTAISASINSSVDYKYFFKAFSSGNFKISFQRSDTGISRTYGVQDAPPSDMLSKFAACVEAL